MFGRQLITEALSLILSRSLLIKILWKTVKKSFQRMERGCAIDYQLPGYY